MGQLVVGNALMTCTMGVAPAPLTVLPVAMVMGGSQPAATIMDHIPMVNIPTFGMCQSPSNPVVIAATAAALGVLTPMPCIPATTAPWMPGAPTTMIGNKPALTVDSKCMCMWAGQVAFSASPASQTITVK